MRIREVNLGLKALGCFAWELTSSMAKTLGLPPLLVFLMLIQLAPISLSSAAIKSPSEFLGKNIGEDRVLANYDEICAYFEYLDSVSEWIEVIDLGKTTLGERLVMVVATSPVVIKEVDEYKSISRLLRDGQISEVEARRNAAQGKVILLDMCSIHSNEIAATQMSLELGYRIAAGDTEICPYLEDVILLIVPSVNPDGHKMICDWYEKWKGTEYDGCWMPWLYHHYAGHDNNRDWYMFNLKETKLISEVMYRTWIPQVVIDHHEMWMTGARFFVPPYTDPVNPNIHPLIWREIEAVGAQMRLAMQEKGLKGVLSNALFTGWWEGASVMTPLWHNVVSLLTEAASVRIASPVYVDRSELEARGTGFPSYTRLSNFPDPWEGGWWRLRDIMDYEICSVIGALKACSRNREDILLNFYRMSHDAIEKGKTESPFAFVVPMDGSESGGNGASRDPACFDYAGQDVFAACEMLRRLMLGGVEIHRATKQFTAQGKTYEPGTYIIYLSQPYRAFVKDIMERQNYPLIRISPESSPLQPYDATAWTLPLKFNVAVDEIEREFDAETVRCDKIDFPPSTIVGEGSHICVARTSLGAYKFLNRCLDMGLPVFTVLGSHGSTHPSAGTEPSSKALGISPGTLVIDLGRNPEISMQKIEEAADGLSLMLQRLDVDRSLLAQIEKPQVAIYQSYLPNEEEGWLRYVLDDFGFSYKVLHNEEMKKRSLLKRFDVIIFPPQQPSIIKQGKPEGRWAQFYEPPPKQYEGGIGDEGIKTIKEYLESGGRIVAIGEACDLFIDELQLPAVDILKNVAEKDFNCPGAFLRLQVDPTNRLCYGMKPITPFLFFYGRAFSTRIPFGKFDRRIAARFADDELLMSGWLNGSELIKGKAAAVTVKFGNGEVVLIGFDPIHRGQTYSTFPLLFNSLF